jgi:hypothetical protein
MPDEEACYPYAAANHLAWFWAASMGQINANQRTRVDIEPDPAPATEPRWIAPAVQLHAPRGAAMVASTVLRPGFQQPCKRRGTNVGAIQP